MKQNPMLAAGVAAMVLGLVVQSSGAEFTREEYLIAAVMHAYRDANFCKARGYAFDEADVAALQSYGRDAAPSVSADQRSRLWSVINDTPVDANLTLESSCLLRRQLILPSINTHVEQGGEPFHWPIEPLTAPF